MSFLIALLGWLGFWGLVVFLPTVYVYAAFEQPPEWVAWPLIAFASAFLFANVFFALGGGRR